MPGPASLGLLHGSPFYATRHGLVKSSGQDCFPPFGWRRQDQEDKAPCCRSKDGGGDEILLLRSIEANRRTCASLMTEARAFARLLRAGRRHCLLAAFRDGRCSKKGLVSAENVILLNILINRYLRK